MGRREFSKETKRAAFVRSGGRCEATGELYGLQPGQRCNMPLNRGVQYDHILADSNGGDPTLDNCCAACPPCHRFKTDKHDKPRAAKITRQQDGARNITGPKPKWQSRPFSRQYEPNVKQIGEDV